MIKKVKTFVKDFINRMFMKSWQDSSTVVQVYGEITGINYSPTLDAKLNLYHINNIGKALNEKGAFILQVSNDNKIAISWWVSPKRTRSYPYARVYDTLTFNGKRVTIIPFMKDEGKRGDRDFIQWDTISLMSLLGVYVIIAYYSHAEPHPRYKNKITKQRFDINYVKQKIKNLCSYQSDPLHWNLQEIDQIDDVALKAIKFYERISKELNVEMHSFENAKRRIEKIKQEKINFLTLSRKLAKEAQEREVKTIQPKERINGTKALITIKNYLGGYYFLTADEIQIKRKTIFLIEAKHTSKNVLPSVNDIKDGLIKMILFTNLKKARIKSTLYNVIPVLKLTNNLASNKIDYLTNEQRILLDKLKNEAKINNFKIKFNDIWIN